MVRNQELSRRIIGVERTFLYCITAMFLVSSCAMAPHDDALETSSQGLQGGLGEQLIRGQRAAKDESECRDACLTGPNTRGWQQNFVDTLTNHHDRQFVIYSRPLCESNCGSEKTANTVWIGQCVRDSNDSGFWANPVNVYPTNQDGEISYCHWFIDAPRLELTGLTNENISQPPRPKDASPVQDASTVKWQLAMSLPQQVAPPNNTVPADEPSAVSMKLNPELMAHVNSEITNIAGSFSNNATTFTSNLSSVPAKAITVPFETFVSKMPASFSVFDSLKSVGSQVTDTLAQAGITSTSHQLVEVAPAQLKQVQVIAIVVAPPLSANSASSNAAEGAALGNGLVNGVQTAQSAAATTVKYVQASIPSIDGKQITQFFVPAGLFGGFGSIGAIGNGFAVRAMQTASPEIKAVVEAINVPRPPQGLSSPVFPSQDKIAPPSSGPVAQAPAPVPPSKTYLVTLRAGLNLYGGPSGTEALKIMPLGMSVTEAGPCDDTLCQIQFEDVPQPTFAEKAYLQEVPADRIPKPQYSGTGTIRQDSIYNLRLRKEPNTSSAVLAGMPPGTKIEIVEVVSSGWLHVKYNGLEGYCAGAWVNLDDAG